jgi:hypothetical protein
MKYLLEPWVIQRFFGHTTYNSIAFRSQYEPGKSQIRLRNVSKSDEDI